jgi:hypothetical protein
MASYTTERVVHVRRWSDALFTIGPLDAAGERFMVCGHMRMIADTSSIAAHEALGAGHG